MVESNPGLCSKVNLNNLNNATPKAWKEHLYKGDTNFHDLTFGGHRNIKKHQIYSLSKCNSKELYSLQSYILSK